MTIFAFFESRVKSICEKIENDFPEKLKYSKGPSEIGKLWNYLIHTCKLNTDKVEPFYRLIDEQRFVRNRIVHHGGYLSEEQKKNVHLVQGLKIKCGHNICKIEITDIEYLKYIIEQIDKFFKELLPSIDEKYKNK